MEYELSVKPIVISVLATAPKGLIKGLKGFEIRRRVQTIQATALLRSARILRINLETWRGLLSLKF